MTRTTHIYSNEDAQRMIEAITAAWIKVTTAAGFLNEHNTPVILDAVEKEIFSK